MDNPCALTHDDSIEVRYHYVLPTTPHSECDVAYRVFGTGRIEVTMTVRPGEGLPDMPEFGLLLTSDADLHHLRWYGEGPTSATSTGAMAPALGCTPATSGVS